MNAYLVIIALLIGYAVFLNICTAKERKHILAMMYCDNVADVKALEEPKKEKSRAIKKSHRKVFGQVKVGDE